MGSFTFTYANRSTREHPSVRTYANLPTPEHPSVRARVEWSRKRFQCDLREFWRRCKPKCRQRHRCLGDPYDCFARHHAAMPHDHAAWLHAAILSKTTGTATTERALRAAGLSLPVLNEVDPAPLSPPQPTAAARDDDARRRAATAPEVPLQSLSETVARLQELLGLPLTGKLEPGPAGAPPSPPASPRADAEAPVVVPKTETRAAVEAFDERARKGMDYNDVMARLRALGRSV